MRGAHYKALVTGRGKRSSRRALQELPNAITAALGLAGSAMPEAAVVADLLPQRPLDTRVLSIRARGANASARGASFTVTLPFRDPSLLSADGSPAIAVGTLIPSPTLNVTCPLSFTAGLGINAVYATNVIGIIGAPARVVLSVSATLAFFVSTNRIDITPADLAAAASIDAVGGAGATAAALLSRYNATALILTADCGPALGEVNIMCAPGSEGGTYTFACPQPVITPMCLAWNVSAREWTPACVASRAANSPAFTCNCDISMVSAGAPLSISARFVVLPLYSNDVFVRALPQTVASAPAAASALIGTALAFAFGLVLSAFLGARADSVDSAAFSKFLRKDPEIAFFCAAAAGRPALLGAPWTSALRTTPNAGGNKIDRDDGSDDDDGIENGSGRSSMRSLRGGSPTTSRLDPRNALSAFLAARLRATGIALPPRVQLAEESSAQAVGFQVTNTRKREPDAFATGALEALVLAAAADNTTSASTRSAVAIMKNGGRKCRFSRASQTLGLMDAPSALAKAAPEITPATASVAPDPGDPSPASTVASLSSPTRVSIPASPARSTAILRGADADSEAAAAEAVDAVAHSFARPDMAASLDAARKAIAALHTPVGVFISAFRIAAARSIARNPLFFCTTFLPARPRAAAALRALAVMLLLQSLVCYLYANSIGALIPNAPTGSYELSPMTPSEAARAAVLAVLAAIPIIAVLEFALARGGESAARAAHPALALEFARRDAADVYLCRSSAIIAAALLAHARARGHAAESADDERTHDISEYDDDDDDDDATVSNEGGSGNKHHLPTPLQMAAESEGFVAAPLSLSQHAPGLVRFFGVHPEQLRDWLIREAPAVAAALSAARDSGVSEAHSRAADMDISEFARAAADARNALNSERCECFRAPRKVVRVVPLAPNDFVDDEPPHPASKDRESNASRATASFAESFCGTRALAVSVVASIATTLFSLFYILVFSLVRGAPAGASALGAGALSIFFWAAIAEPLFILGATVSAIVCAPAAARACGWIPLRACRIARDAALRFAQTAPRGELAQRARVLIVPRAAAAVGGWSASNAPLVFARLVDLAAIIAAPALPQPLARARTLRRARYAALLLGLPPSALAQMTTQAAEAETAFAAATSKAFVESAAASAALGSETKIATDSALKTDAAGGEAIAEPSAVTYTPDGPSSTSTPAEPVEQVTERAPIPLRVPLPRRGGTSSGVLAAAAGLNLGPLRAGSGPRFASGANDIFQAALAGAANSSGRAEMGRSDEFAPPPMDPPPASSASAGLFMRALSGARFMGKRGGARGGAAGGRGLPVLATKKLSPLANGTHQTATALANGTQTAAATSPGTIFSSALRGAGRSALHARPAAGAAAPPRIVAMRIAGAASLSQSAAKSESSVSDKE